MCATEWIQELEAFACVGGAAEHELPACQVVNFSRRWKWYMQYPSLRFPQPISL